MSFIQKVKSQGDRSFQLTYLFLVLEMVSGSVYSGEQKPLWVIFQREEIYYMKLVPNV